MALIALCVVKLHKNNFNFCPKMAQTFTTMIPIQEHDDDSIQDTSNNDEELMREIDDLEQLIEAELKYF